MLIIIIIMFSYIYMGISGTYPRYDFNVGFLHLPAMFGFSLPSGKHTKSYGKSPFLRCKSTTNGSFQ